MEKCRIRAGVRLAAVAALIVLGLVLRPPLWCYCQFTWHRHVLPTRLIRSAIKFSTGHDAPAKMEDGRGIIQGGREPSFFIGFRTDDEGLRYILREFGEGSTIEVLDEEKLRCGWHAFAGPVHWQKELGVQIYDQDTIHAGKLLTCLSVGGLDPGYTIVIDEQHGAVYIWAMPWH
jgi:hypothetical protein